MLSLGLWKLNATVVERLVQGRVLLCGDAAHQFPPTGGLGVNTGLQGMHNAMWKLAWYVLGRAGWPLVETYETERRGVAQRITSQSLQNSINVQRISAAIAGDGAEALPQRRAGRRRIAPLRQPPRRRVRRRLRLVRRHRRRHEPAGRRRQLLRLRPLGHAGRPRAARLARRPGAPSRPSTCSAARSRCSPAPEAGLVGAAHDAATPPASRSIATASAPPASTTSAASRAYGLANDGAVLVRPDGHVAWRHATEPAAASTLIVVAQTITARAPASS